MSEEKYLILTRQQSEGHIHPMTKEEAITVASGLLQPDITPLVIVKMAGTVALNPRDLSPFVHWLE